MSGFRFAEPQFVHLLWGVALCVAGLFWLERRGGHALSRFVSDALQPRLVTRPTALRRYARLALLGLSGVFLVLALMRPQWGLEFVRTPRVGAEIMIALDVSKSMLAEDVAPNRLERAKAEIRDLLGYLEGDQVGLIAFAGRASVVSPLTPDFGFLRLVLDGLHAGSVRPGGTRLEEPIRKAVAGFGELGDASRVILLITDGEDHGSFPLDAAQDAAEHGVTILAVGFGDEGGSEIRITDPETGARTLLRASDGSVVRSRLDGETLREIALATRGAYIPAGTGVLDLESIFEAHIAPLMRGQVEGKGRSVQQEGYQWAVLLGLIALFASVATNARAGALLLVAALLSAAPGPGAFGVAHAQVSQSPGAPATPLLDAESGEEAGELAVLEVPEDPREAYNLGLDALSAERLDDAAQLLEATRAAAAGDGEARYRATFNLGWVSVKRADAMLGSEPESALAALERAADWFSEAVAMRPSSEEARRNLEIVLQRALILSDQLNQTADKDVAARLEELIERQRASLHAIRQVVDRVAGRDDPDAVSGLREVFRSAAVEERKVLSDAAALSKFAGEELATLEEIPDAERSPEQGMRVAQLSALLHYLHRARERIGQARSLLRQRQAEHGFRRAAAGLTSLHRARDQLQDPVRVLDALLVDAGRLSVETRTLLASRLDLLPVATPQEPALELPRWLTESYLTQAQEDLAGRTGELQVRLKSGLSSLEDAPPEDPGQALLVEALRAAEPLVRDSHDSMLVAHRSLSDEDLDEAVLPQAEATLWLAQAREYFLDLKGLIELAYVDERRIGAILDPEAEAAEGQLHEYLPALGALQESNLARLGRIGPLLELEQARRQAQAAEAEADEETLAKQAEQEQQLFEAARAIVGFTRGEMQAAREGLVALESSPDSLAALRADVASAVSGLSQLRRLFFSLLEHLRETAERQLELGDATEAVVALAEAEPEETALRAGPLAPRQDQLAAVAEQIGMSLHEQAHAPPPPVADDSQRNAQQAEEMTQRMTEAAELVIVGHEAMLEASAALSADPPTYDLARARQDLAFEKLVQALALLSPPPQEEQEEGEQGESEDEQQQGGEGEPEQQQEEGADPSQLLQAVRDREAQRHRDRSEASAAGYEPVEKDW